MGAVAALRTLSAPTATVRRAGHERRVDACEVVVGAVLRVAEGDVVAAVARLLAARELEVADSLLTGESLPVTRASETLAPFGAGEWRPTMVLDGRRIVMVEAMHRVLTDRAFLVHRRGGGR